MVEHARDRGLARIFDRGRRGRWAAGALVAGLLILRMPSLWRQLFDPDEAVLADQAITLTHGGQLYTDAIDRKPPLPAEIYRGIFDLTSSTDLRPVHLMVTVCLGLAAWMISTDPSLRDRRSRWTAAALFVLGCVAFLPSTAQSANFAHFAVLPGAAAMVLARRSERGSAFVAGVAVILAVGCRQTWLIGIPASAVSIWCVGKKMRFAEWLAGLGVGAAVVVVVSGDAAGMLHWAILGTGGFLTSLPSTAGLAQALGVNVVGQVVVMHAALLWLVWRARSTWRAHPDLWVWVCSGLIAFIAGWRFFGHYFLQSLPPMAVLAAPVLVGLTSHHRRRAIAVLAATALATLGLAFWPAIVRSYPNPTRFAATVDALTLPGQKVLVWGNYPEALWTADRPAAGAFVHSDFVTGLTGYRDPDPSTVATVPVATTTAFMTAVVRQRPTLVVDTSTAGMRGYGSYPMTVVPELERLIKRCYRRTTVVDRVTVYRRVGCASG
ncbi:hypothetical protein [Calidifontibacter terrae]